MAEHDLIALAEKCEAATGPDRGLDAEIGSVMHGSKGWHAGDCLVDFTASLDAAMTLVPEGHGWRLDYVGAGKGYSRAIVGGSMGDWPEVATPALALCAAALRARARGGAE